MPYPVAGAVAPRPAQDALPGQPHARRALEDVLPGRNVGPASRPDTKTGGRAVPLAPSAVRLLESLPRDEDNPWVIAGKKPGSHLTDLQHPWRRIRARAKLDDVRIHDLRHRYASRALALGESLTMIGNHQAMS